jgi:hypothetical protein
MTFGGDTNTYRGAVENLLKGSGNKLSGYSGFSQLKEKSDPGGWKKSIEDFVDLIK